MRKNIARGSVRRIVVAAALSVGLACSYGGLAPAAMSSPGQLGLVASVALPGGASAVAVQGNIVTAASAGSVSIIDANSLTVRSTVTLPQVSTNPYSKALPEVVLTSDGALAYVLAGQGLFVVDTAAGTLIRWVEIAACLSGMTISPDDARLNVIADCGSDSAIWSIDPVTLVVGDKNDTLYGFNDGLGRPYGRLASSLDRTFAMAFRPVFKCPDMNGCPVPDAIISVTGASATSLVSGPVETGEALIRDPADGTLLALTPQLTWMEFTGLPADQSLIRIDADSGAQLGQINGLGSQTGSLREPTSMGDSSYAGGELPSQVAALSLDPVARRVYGLRSSMNSLVVVDLVSNSVLGEVKARVKGQYGVAFSDGRGYVATDAGVNVIDPRKTLAPSAPQSVSLKIQPAGKGRVKATITWKAPVSAGASPVTGYAVRARSEDPGLAVDIRSQATCSTRKMKCVLFLKQVKTSDDFYPAFYGVRVNATSKLGAGASSQVFVRG